jgi:hypothetical protein
VTGPTLDELRTWIFATRSDIAEVLRTDVRTVSRGIAMGQIPAVRISDSTIRIPVAAFLKRCGLVDDAEAKALAETDLESSEGEPGSSPIATAIPIGTTQIGRVQCGSRSG